MKKQLKRCNKKEKELIEQRIEKLTNRKYILNEKNVDIVINTLNKEERRHKSELEKKKKEEKERQRLVKEGKIEDKIYMAGKHKLNDEELQEILISKLILDIYIYIL